ncbi:MAG: hypothetical protein N3A64_04820 [Desulfobacterota bacterium]|nr:hypothetical protein [Thermodesulfobacteriota bacterium]
MPQIELTPQEGKTLQEILSRYLPDLQREIADTDKKEFRRSLEEMEILINKLIQLLGKTTG